MFDLMIHHEFDQTVVVSQKGNVLNYVLGHPQFSLTTIVFFLGTREKKEKHNFQTVSMCYSLRLCFIPYIMYQHWCKSVSVCMTESYKVLWVPSRCRNALLPAYNVESLAVSPIICGPHSQLTVRAVNSQQTRGRCCLLSNLSI